LRLGIRVVRVDEHTDHCEGRHQFVQQLEVLRPQRSADKGHAGQVAARLVEAGDEAGRDRVFGGREDDGDRRGRRLDRACCDTGGRDDHGHPPANQLGRQSGQAIVVILRPAVFDRQVLALDKAEILHALEERGHIGCNRFGRCSADEPDHRDRRLLRLCRERPCRCGADHRNEIAPPDRVMASAQIVSVFQGPPFGHDVPHCNTTAPSSRLLCRFLYQPPAFSSGEFRCRTWR